MKILHFADLHVQDGKLLKLDIFIKTLYNIYNFAIKNNIKDVIFAGDFFDKRHNKRWVYDSIVEFFITSNKCNWYLGMGNHDLDRQGHSLELFEILKKFDNFSHIKIINVPGVIEIANYKIKVIHGVIKNAILDNGHKTHPDYVDITKEEIEGYDYVAAGHLHRHQKLHPDIFGYYSGSPIQLNFGEKNQEKGWVVCDLKNKEIQFIENQDYKKFEEINVNYDFINNSFELDVSRIPKNSFLKFVVYGNSSQIAKFKSFEVKKIAKELDYVVEGKISGLLKKQTISFEKNDENRTIEEDGKKYIDELDFEEEINKKYLFSMFCDYINKGNKN